MTPRWSRFTVLSRYGFSRLFESRMFTAFTVVCFVPFLFGLGYIYLVNSTAVQALLNIRSGNAMAGTVNNKWFLGFLGFEGWMAFILTAWGAPGMISKDFANHSIQLYLSRPLSRAEYLLGKVSVLATLLSFTTWVPALILFAIEAELRGAGWGRQNLWMAGSIFVACALWIGLISLLAMAIAVWVRWRIAATLLLFATFLLLPAFGFVMNLILRTTWGSLFNLPHMLTLVWASLFRIPLHHVQTSSEAIPLWAAWASLLTVCLFSLWLLNLRLRAREVERG
jgi:ABC-type transport system involved in multi-copper enzyme maturation permease subunit